MGEGSTMLSVLPEGIPDELKQIQQFVVWKIDSRGGSPTKLPFQKSGILAKSNDPDTWMSYEQALKLYSLGSWAGIGFMFHADDPYCGIDLDGCRDQETGEVNEWARSIIDRFSTYSEVSPSGTGVKMWVKGGWPFAGHRQILKDVPTIEGKTAAIEVYDSVRYFALTGRVLGTKEIPDRQEQLNELRKQYWPAVQPTVANADWKSNDAVMDRARKYIAKIPPSVSGQFGSVPAFHVACVCVCGFGLNRAETFALMSEWNLNCLPPWADWEINHKIDGAIAAPGEKGYLRNVDQRNYDRVPMQSYKMPEERSQVKAKGMTLAKSAGLYIDQLKTGGERLITLGIPELDKAIGGGLAIGEMMLLGARPNHGKSGCSLQFAHHWTVNSRPCLFISTEMSAMALGKRSVQFATDVWQSRWVESVADVERQTEEHFQRRADCFVEVDCGRVADAVELIRQYRDEHQVECVVVDYAQNLGGKASGRYEEMTKTSIALRQAATANNIVLVALVQMSRAIEQRKKFVPAMSDCKESGQFEQDADVIVFSVWPYRINPENPMNDYQFHVMKNRNREIVTPVVLCKFDPSRQTFTGESAAIPFEPTGGYFAQASQRDSDGF